MKLSATLLFAILYFYCGTASYAQIRQSDQQTGQQTDQASSNQAGKQAGQSTEDAMAASLAESRKLIMSGQSKSAIAKLSSLPNQSDIRVIHLLGVAHYQIADYAQAIGLLTQVWDNLPANSPERREAIELLGTSHYLIGHVADSLPFLEQAKAWATGNMELSFITGVAYIDGKQPAMARESFARLFKAAPESGTASLVTALMMMRFKADSLAEAELKLALEKEPKLAGANFWLGQLMHRRGQYGEAIVLLEKELTINPSNGMAYYLIGDAYTRQSKWDEALPTLRKAIWLEPYFTESYVLLGKTYLNKKNYGLAETMLKRAIQFDRNNKQAHSLLGQLYEQTGRSLEAKQELAIAEGLPADNK